MSTRRQFQKSIPIVATAGAVGMSHLAQAAPLVTEADPRAAAFGYRADTTRVVKAK